MLLNNQLIIVNVREDVTEGTVELLGSTDVFKSLVTIIIAHWH